MFRFKLSVFAAVALAAASVGTQTSVAWTEYNLPSLPNAFAPTALAVLPDGRFVFANQGSYYRQDAFGAANYTAYTNTSPGNGADPSFIAIFDATHAVAGGGGFGASDLYRFDPSSLNTPTFTAQSLVLQNYSGVFRNATSLYVGGGNGTSGSHSISFVDLNSATFKVIIDNISTYSCDFARDAAGNLYVGDNDDGKVYKFTSAQLDLAITGSALAITDGAFVHQFGNALGTMAVDGWGRIWSAGFMQNGIQVYDPGADAETTVIPGLNNANYKVTTFSVAGQDYVAYLNQANPFAGGTAQFYGFAPVPEPTTILLTLAGLATLAATHRKQLRR